MFWDQWKTREDWRKRALFWNRLYIWQFSLGIILFFLTARLGQGVAGFRHLFYSNHIKFWINIAGVFFLVAGFMCLQIFCKYMRQVSRVLNSPFNKTNG